RSGPKSGESGRVVHRPRRYGRARPAQEAEADNSGRLIIGLLPPPTLRECCHRGFATVHISARWPTVLVVAIGQAPEPRSVCPVFVDAADELAFAQHAVIVEAGMGQQGALQD